MSASSVARKVSSTGLREGWAAWQSRAEAVSIAQKLTQRHERIMKDAEAEAAESAVKALQQRLETSKSFSFHLGADINIPTATPRAQSLRPSANVESPTTGNPFAGLPLQAWAERLGERIMPAYDLIREEQKRAKSAAKPAVAVPPTYSVPHLLPFTRWAANSKSIRETFVVEDPKTRKKARMSWYHPDDTMVPRDWFKGGLLEDLKYYTPFLSSGTAAN